MAKMVTCRVLDADGWWEYSDWLAVAPWLAVQPEVTADLEAYMRRKVEFEAMLAYWKSLEKEIVIQEVE